MFKSMNGDKVGQGWIYNTFLLSSRNQPIIKQTIETEAEKLLKVDWQSDRLSQWLTQACYPSLFRHFETVAERSYMESGRAGPSTFYLCAQCVSCNEVKIVKSNIYSISFRIYRIGLFDFKRNK